MVERSQRGAQNRRRVTLNYYHVRSLLLQIFGNCSYSACRKSRKRLIRLHQIQICIGFDFEPFQDLIQQEAVLTADANRAFELRVPAQRKNHGSQFDGFRTCPENNGYPHTILNSNRLLSSSHSPCFSRSHETLANGSSPG